MSGESRVPLRAVCFDFDGTLAYMDPPHRQLYVLAANDLGGHLDEESLADVLGSDSGGGLGGWGPWRTPGGVDHSAHSGSAADFRALRVRLHLERLEAADARAPEGGTLEGIAARVADLEADAAFYHLFPDSRPALERLREAGIAAVIVSNHIWTLPEIVAALGLDDLCSAVITSARVGYRKPHPAIYRAALEATGAEAASILFVGDNIPADVEGPRRAGMRALYLRRTGSEGTRPSASDAIPTIASLAELPLS